MMQQMMGGKGSGPYGGGKGGMGKMAMMSMMMGGMGGMMDMQSIIKMTWQTAPGGEYKNRTPGQQVCMKNLPPDTTDYDLYKLCAPFGAIAPGGVKAMLSGEGECTGTGWIDFVTEEDAAIACQNLNGFMGMRVQTKWAKPAAQA